MKKVLTIAGSDPSGGAGIQADIKTITAHGMYAMSAITALTAQNTTGVFGVLDTPSEFLAKQLDCIFTDIFPEAIKIGMVPSGEIMQVITDKLKQYGAKNIVLDPVMFSSSGKALMNEQAMDTLKDILIKTSDLITPNIFEAESLSDCEIKDKNDMKKAAELISYMFDGAILLKGGHLEDCADDLLYADKKYYWFKADRIDNPNTHGTGCTLSSAIACNLAEGFTLETSIKNAKKYLINALKADLNLGKGSGPLNHCFSINKL